MDVLTWLRAQWDRVLGFGLVAAGAVALVIGYDKAASTRYLAEQITVLISGGLGGIFCLGAGATLLVCADIRDEWRKLDRIEDVLLEIRDDLGLPRRSGQPLPTAGGPGSGAPEAGGGDGPGEQAESGPPARLVGRALAIPAGLLGLAGLAAVIGGWEASASTTRASASLDAAGWSAAGLILAAIGAAVCIVGLKRSVRIRQAGLLGPVALQGSRRAAGPRMPSAAHSSPGGNVVYAAGLRHFHRPGCAALAGIGTDACERAVAAEWLAPCPLCEP